GSVGMCAKNGGGRQWTNLAGEAGFYCLRLASIGYDCENLPHFENLAHGHRKRLLWYLRDVREPCFAHLLAPTGLIKVHDNVRFLDLKICGRIVERDVAVFTDAQKSDVNRRRSQLATDALRDLARIVRVAVEQVIANDSSFLDQLFQQHFAEAAGMRNRQADVFVKMEGLHFGPVDAG